MPMCQGEVGRVTGPGEIVADAMNKGDLGKAMKTMKLNTLLRWWENPVAIGNLGCEILEDMRQPLEYY